MMKNLKSIMSVLLALWIVGVMDCRRYADICPSTGKTGCNDCS